MAGPIRPVSEILLGETDALFWEPDVYWITFGGDDPAAWISRYAARSHLIHLKDMKPEPLPVDPIDANARDLQAHLSAALGEGTIDLAPAIAAAKDAKWDRPASVTLSCLSRRFAPFAIQSIQSIQTVFALLALRRLIEVQAGGQISAGI